MNANWAPPVVEASTLPDDSIVRVTNVTKSFGLSLNETDNSIKFPVSNLTPPRSVRDRS